jgi:DNA-binding NtrC family response regulator
MNSHAPATAFEVLIVDDEPETRDVLSEFCRALGLTVATAEDGRAAQAAIERAPSQYQVVLTDICMPGADGFEVMKTAREANASVYVVMISGYATLDSALRAVREGAYDFLAKPFALGQLEMLLARIRDRMSLEHENRMLTRQVDGLRDGGGVPRRDMLTLRLDAIEQRLSRIEDLLRHSTRPH